MSFSAQSVNENLSKRKGSKSPLKLLIQFELVCINQDNKRKEKKEPRMNAVNVRFMHIEQTDAEFGTIRCEKL